MFYCRCIVTSLADPNTLLFDHLLTLKPVKFLEGELIHDVSRLSFCIFYLQSSSWMGKPLTTSTVIRWKWKMEIKDCRRTVEGALYNLGSGS